MKINFISKALLMGGVLAMAACSNDEPAMNNGNNGDGNADGNVAYMKVRIKSADRNSRATTDGDYAYGTAAENDVKNVRFYFFDNTGASMDLTAYLVKNDGNVNINRKPENGTENVEAVFAENLLVLEDLTSNEYPNYMLTVLNAPDFKAGNNLTATLALLDDYKHAISGETEYFVMSTSSYFDGKNAEDNHDDNYYFVTQLQPENFYQTPDAAVTEGNAVEVYVERLAAKVQLTVGLEGSNGLYALDQTVAGDDNTENNDAVLDTKLYVKILGWDLNTTANKSYMSKNIDKAWNFTWQGDDWNNANDFRSFWAKSYVYNDNLDAVKAGNKFTYAKTNNLKLDVTNNNVAYCNENTNIVGNIMSKQEQNGQTRWLVDNRMVTNVVLRTQICDAEGNPLTMVMANGVLFRENAYLQYILNRAYVGENALNIWVKTNETTEGGVTTAEFAQIGTEFFKLVRPGKDDYLGVGDVDVVVDETAFEGKTFYSYDAAITEGSKYKEMTAEELTAAIESIKTKLAAVQPEGSNHAVIYDKGNSVYYIPVEHLAAEDGKDKDIEGYYGVVRNHWYKLTINSFSKVGHGIWEPGTGEDETEVLEPEEPEDPLYYLGASINILSWKVVNQGVDL